MSDLRIGVVGVGVMGANHARVARQVRRAHLAAVVDRDIARAEALARPTGALAAASLDDALGHIDLAVIAVPTQAHVDVVEQCFAAGAHFLVEKPIAGNVADAERLVAGAQQAGVTLAGGHIERFNAAVAELPQHSEDPVHITATRVSPYSPRIADGVIHDLMIHDLDIVLSLAGREAEVTHTAGVSRCTRSATEDLAVVSLGFDTGLTASFVTSRIAQQKVRLLEITQADSVVHADLVRQDITIHRMSRHEYLADDGVRYRQSSVLEVPFLESRGEPLVRELQDVVDAILDRRAPTVSGTDGTRAVALADRISATIHRETVPS
ncbi:Gfo/Idh/MocA family oxidoreductase [soil metagenome]